MHRSRAVVLLSGGMDSCVCAASAAHTQESMPPLSRTTARLRLPVEFDFGKLVILLNSITLALNYTFQHEKYNLPLPPRSAPHPAYFHAQSCPKTRSLSHLLLI